MLGNTTEADLYHSVLTEERGWQIARACARSTQSWTVLLQESRLPVLLKILSPIY